MRAKKCSLEIANNKMERQPLDRLLLPCYAYSENLHHSLADQIPPHWHLEFEIFIIDCGEVLVSLACEEFRLTQGQGYFITSNKLHSVQCMVQSPCLYRSVVFDSSIISGTESSIFHYKYIRPLLENAPSAFMLDSLESWQQPIFTAFDEAVSACADRPFGYEFTLRHLLSQIVLLLTEHNCLAPCVLSPYSQQEDRLKEMIAWLDVNYTHTVKLQSLAQAVNISCRECERIFKQLLHISPMTYLLRRRITAASQILAYCDLPITEVGLNCGFSNHSYFSKTFHALTGYSPRDYRRHIRTL